MRKFLIFNFQFLILIAIITLAIFPLKATATISDCDPVYIENLTNGLLGRCNTALVVDFDPYNLPKGSDVCAARTDGRTDCIQKRTGETTQPIYNQYTCCKPDPSTCDATTFTVSPSSPYLNDILTFTYYPEHYNQSITLNPPLGTSSPITGCSSFYPSPFTCNAQYPYSGSVSYNWWYCGPGIISCSLTDPAPPLICSQSVYYSVVNRPRPTPPKICRKKDFGYPLVGQTYESGQLTVSRTDIKNDNEWLYILINDTGAYYSSVGDKQLTRADTSFSFPYFSLNTGEIYFATVCNRQMTFGTYFIDTTYCSISATFCMSATGYPCLGETFKPSECVIPPPIYCPGGGGQAGATGLVSAPTKTGNFGTTGACVIDQKTAFAPYEIPTYEDLKSIYYTQAKSSDTVIKHDSLTGEKSQADIPLTSNKDHIYQINGNLTISGNIPGNQTGVVFVDGNLTVSRNITTGANVGLVFVVGDNVNIDPTVTQIDAVIISSGTIHTAGVTCTTNNVETNPLIINGSLVSLDTSKPIIFCRKLTDNSQAAEKIVHQPKYLIILRNLFATNQQFWSEIP